ncbi:glucosaminidase domain-containing protein [Halosquirtibacter laminarini]|uniref:Glucosaminidase domain-containing protein n=1 Tax=Halosquirtibacter laminarini TaxID=3374600 RepID=A0AC61NDS0_9BACT|nr:glucosaminidase domain-containing protein [Prolixibacteraceae bacterium]
MKKTSLFLLVLYSVFLINTPALANNKKKFRPKNPLTRKEYIEKYREISIKEMNLYHIPASITLAQGILESGDGNSYLAVKAKNHFGVKCHSSWDGPSVRLDDDKKNECFRKYKTVEHSYKDHSIFLQQKRYQPLYKHKITDYKRWARGLKKAGYATNPKYPQLLIRIIEENDLAQYDQFYQKDYNTHKASPFDRGSGGFKFTIGNKNRITENNKSRMIVSVKGDTYLSIAQKYGLKEWEIFNYNDAHESDLPKPNTNVYLERKRGKAARGTNTHVVVEGENMHDISQKYGIRLKALYRRNRMSRGRQPNVGDTIYLRGRAPRNR